MKTNPTLVKQIVRLHKKGWHVVNIASIARVKPDVVKEVLREKNLLM